jgi:hypothetical protein
MAAFGRELCALLGGMFRKEIFSEKNVSYLDKYPVEGIENPVRCGLLKSRDQKLEPSSCGFYLPELV